jgi:hypothetical protein
MKRVFSVLSVITGVILTLFTGKVSAQSLPVNTTVLEDYYRRMQLLGKVDSNESFTTRPLLSNKLLKVQNIFDPENSLKGSDSVNSGSFVFGKGRGLLQILPISWQQQFNSDHPYGWNDGPMIPAKGYQTMISGGFYLKYGPLSIQLRPEYVYADNPAFNGFASGHSDQDQITYYQFHYQIDLPERYGNTTYKRAFLGQSSIRLTFGPISLGVSNENLWWGPGIKNALIMSGNAPGFEHFIINTVYPINTFLGSFEAQFIGGKCVLSGYPLLLNDVLSDGRTLSSFVPAQNTDWRYFTGFNINYHPKFVPGLTLGLTRTFNAYQSDVKANGFSAYVPFFTPFAKKNTLNANGDPFGRDQQTSIYARWLFTKAQAEVYVEYGLTDNSYNLADFIQSPGHSRAYLFGVRKMIPTNRKGDHILFGTQLTQISLTTDRLTRPAQGFWYLHGAVTSGDTNQGQVLGSGTGPGGNSQSFDVSWVSGLKKIGIDFERYEHDVDFSEGGLPNINGNSRRWVDFAFAVNGEWNYKNFLFNAKLQGIRSLNYQWILKDYNPDQYYIPHNSVNNFHGELGITYRF